MTLTQLAGAIRSATAARGDMQSLGILGCFRLAAGVLQFVTILYITGYLSLKDLGDYSMFVIVLGYFTQLAGFNFSTFLIRELGAHERDAWPALLLQQLRFLSVSYPVSVGIVLVGAALGLVPSTFVVPFSVILLLSLVNLALENYMVGAGHPMPAALNVLLRAGWIVAVIAGAFLGFVPPLLLSVLIIWAAGELLAALAILLQIRRKGLLPARLYPTDGAWILRGWRVGSRYTVLGLLLLVTLSIQRVVLAHFHPQEQVGILHFYFAISVFIPNLLEASLFAMILPRMIRRHLEEGGDRMLAPDRKVIAGLGLTGAAGLLAVAAFLPWLLRVLGKTELLDYRYLLLFTGPYALLYAAARVFHYQLYAGHRDRALTRGYIAAAAVACATSLVLIPPYALNGAAVALVAAGVAMLLALAAPFLRLRGAPA
jgi:O-antigen/teichoic acid export membrane protein